MTNFESLKILIFHRVQGGKIVENDAAGEKKNLCLSSPEQELATLLLQKKRTEHTEQVGDWTVSEGM